MEVREIKVKKIESRKRIQRLLQIHVLNKNYIKMIYSTYFYNITDTLYNISMILYSI